LLFSEFLGLSEVAFCFLDLTKALVGQSPILVGSGVLRVEANGLVVGFDISVVLAQLSVGVPTDAGIGVLWKILEFLKSYDRFVTKHHILGHDQPCVIYAPSGKTSLVFFS